jgi:hypothetical protein
MKFLKLFESKYYDEFEKLKQITGVDNIQIQNIVSGKIESGITSLEWVP